jgi:uracil-DNA glycosylase
MESLERDTMGDSWRSALEKEFIKPYFQKVCLNISSGQLPLMRFIDIKLKEFLISEHKAHTVYPKRE